MVFSTPEFLFIFLPIVFLIYNIPVRSMRYKNVVLIVSSLIFYAYGEPVYIILMIASVVINYILTRAVISGANSNKAKIAVTSAVIFNIGMLAVFKYADMIVSLVNVLPRVMIPEPNIRLPIGISFFTFQALSLCIDMYRQRSTETKLHFTDVLLYISFFPQLVAGPIVQYHDVQTMLRTRKASADDIAQGVRRFTFGLGKKILIANVLAVVCDRFYALPAGELTAMSAWIAAITYMLQIYFDFSGYSDMAIGMGRMFGFKFRENFDLPYTASGMRDFWRRWHISLSYWFREYLYIPLGGSRCSKLKTARNRMIVFMCTGLWHGAGLNFLLWGVWNGVFVTAEGLMGKRLPRAVGKIYTLAAVLLGFVLFRAESVGQAMSVYKAMFGGGSQLQSDLSQAFEILSPYFIGTLCVAVLLSSSLPRYIARRVTGSTLDMTAGSDTALGKRLLIMNILSYAAALFILLWCIPEMVSSSYNPFIYYRF